MADNIMYDQETYSDITDGTNGSAADEIQYPLDELERFHEAYYGVVMFLSALGVVLNLIGIAVITLRRRSQCSESRFVMLLSLGCSDMFVCVSMATSLSVTFYVINEKSDFRDGEEADGGAYDCLSAAIEALAPTAQSVSLLNLLGMAIDHYVAIVKPLHYEGIMNRSRAIIMVTAFWIASFILGGADLYSGAGRSDGEQSDYCAYVQGNRDMHPDYVLLCVVLFCLISMSILYTRVYFEIARAARRLPPPRHDFGQSRRALLTTWLILGTFLVCWLPGYLLSLFLTIAAALHQEDSAVVLDRSTKVEFYKVQQILVSVCLLNSLCDPIIYMTHMSKLTGLCRQRIGRKISWEKKLQTSREPLTRNTSL